jgi:hypothetical protein
MRIPKKQFGAGITTLFITSIAIQSLITAQAERMGYVQSNCPIIVQQAIAAVSADCAKTGRNKLCYGNNSIRAEFQPGAGPITFQAPGDLVGVPLVRQFTLGGMDTAANTWGMAEMKIQANLPDTDPTQNVTLILFGDVQVTDAALDANATAIALTPTASRDLQTQVGTPAIISTSAPNVNGPPPYGALQAFYFKSGDSAPCDQAPHDGILIQSPQGTQRVTLSIDGAIVSLGSTVFVRAQPSNFLTINTLEGSAQITANNMTQVIPAGSAVQVPIDANLRASGAPNPPQFYNADTVRALPLQLLPTLIIPVPGLPPNPTANQATATPIPPPSTRLPAINAGLICTATGPEPPSSITFINNSDQVLLVNWVNYQCKETLYRQLSAHSQYTQPTYRGHVWRIRDSSGVVVAQVVSSTSAQEVTIP